MLSASRRSRIRLAMYLSIAVAPLGGEVDLDFAFFISALTVDDLEKAIPVTGDVPYARRRPLNASLMFVDQAWPSGETLSTSLHAVSVCITRSEQ